MTPINQSTAAAAPIPKGINAVPNVIRLEILKGLGTNDLCNMARSNKSWQKLHDNKPLWTQLASKLRIRLVDPENAKAEVIDFWKTLPEINEHLEIFGVKSQIKDPFERNQALQALIKESLLNEKSNQELSEITKKMISEFRSKQTTGHSLTKVEKLTLQIAIDVGITPFKNHSELMWNASNWDYTISHIDYPVGFEQYFLGQDISAKSHESSFIGRHATTHIIDLLSKSIFHANKAFIEFLIDRLHKILLIDGEPIDWALIYVESWFGAFQAGLDPNNPSIKSMVTLFDKYKTLDPKEKLRVFQKADWYRTHLEKDIKELEADPTIEGARREDLPFHKEELANINRGIDFLRQHFLTADAAAKK